MGRLVQPAQLERVIIRSGGGGLESTGGVTTIAVGGDSYQDRLAKYIPGEVIAAYIALDRTLVPDATAFQASAPIKTASVGLLSNPAVEQALHLSLPFVVLIIGLIFTPLYIRQLAHNSGAPAPWRTQAVVSTLAFLVWAYAIQGSAFTVGVGEGLYRGNWASALVIVFTLASGLFTPTPVYPDRASP